MKAKLTNKRGFTLIELVIVLAIVALILVGILLAVAGAQNSRKNGQRKNDAAKIGSDLEAAASNRNGCYPTLTCTGATGITIAQFMTSYTNQITTPDNNTYTVVAAGTYGTCPAPGAVPIDTAQVSFGGTGNRSWQVAMGLDNGSGGAGDVYCATSG